MTCEEWTGSVWSEGLNYEQADGVKEERSMSPLVLTYLYWWLAAAG